MGIELVPAETRDRFHIEERRHACAILASDFPSEFREIIDCLNHFELVRSEIVASGGGKSKIANRFDGFLKVRAWGPKIIRVGMVVDGQERNLETHEVDFCKAKVAVEVEWNNKDPFFSRDLDAFRLLHQLGSISVGVIITRSDELQEIFDNLGYYFDRKAGKPIKVGTKYGASTTHWKKLMPRIASGGGGACPLLLVGITRKCYRDDMPHVPIQTAP